MIRHTVVRTVPPAQPTVTVAELKDHCRTPQSFTGDDDYFERWEKAATRLIEDELGLALMEQTHELRLECFPTCEIPVPQPPLLAVSSVTYLDLNGDRQTLDDDVYEVDTTDTPGLIRLGYNQSWPAHRVRPGSIVVTYTCGHTNNEEVDEELRQAVKMLVAEMEEQRETTLTGTISEQLPLLARLGVQQRTYVRPIYQ